MRETQYSLAKLTGFVAVAALTLAAIRLLLPVFNPGILGLLFCVAVLIAGLLALVFRPQAHRAYWLGFEAFGWIYLLWSINVPTLLLLPNVLVTHGVIEDNEFYIALMTLLFLVPTLLIAHMGGLIARWFLVSRKVQ